jgi:ribonuclease P protein component
LQAQPAAIAGQLRSVIVMDARFPRSARVRTRVEYSRVFDGGRRTSHPLLSLHWHADDQPPRLGLAVSRKVDPNAVGRNRIKRALREQFRALRPLLASGDYVLVAGAGGAPTPPRGRRPPRPRRATCAPLSYPCCIVPARCRHPTRAAQCLPPCVNPLRPSPYRPPGLLRPRMFRPK